ncbi:MAG TPA: hypothetical protein VFX76_15585, partial [Roseiflexaceae bacterium]|nr:hypothetical protein [Roseiflexaceae bacterium]
HAEILALTHGHPLALSLVADLAGQGEQGFHYEQTPDVVAMLLERFVRDVPTPQHRMALYACATARTLTESLLRAALAQPDVAAIFEWLRSLSFIEQGPLGLFPHDLARDILSADLRWRDLEAYLELHRRIRRGLSERLFHVSGIEQQRATFDLVYLHRNNPILKPYYDWQTFGTLYSETVRPDEHARILQQIAGFAGEEAAALAEHWIERQPSAWQAIRDSNGRIAGVFMYLQLHQTTAEDRQRDPAVAHAWEYACRQTPFRPGDEVTLARYYAALPDYLSPSPVMNTAQIATGQRWMTNPRLTWAFTDLIEPDHWYGMMSYYDFHRVANPQFGLYAHNWRATPVAEW